MTRNVWRSRSASWSHPAAAWIPMPSRRSLAIELPAVLGHPQRALSGEAQRAKFDACCAHAGLSPDAVARLHEACAGLAELPDVAALVQRMHP